MNVHGGQLARRVVLEGLGWILVVAGIAALILPGPGLLAIFAGLALLSQQYEWAERRLEPVKLQALRGAAESVESPARIVLSCLSAAGIMAFGVLWIIDPPAPAWWPLRESWWLIGGLGTGITLIVSGLIAYGLLVYSYRRFHGKPEARAELERDIADGPDDEPDEEHGPDGPDGHGEVGEAARRTR